MVLICSICPCSWHETSPWPRSSGQQKVTEHRAGKRHSKAVRMCPIEAALVRGLGGRLGSFPTSAHHGTRVAKPGLEPGLTPDYPSHWGALACLLNYQDVKGSSLGRWRCHGGGKNGCGFAESTLRHMVFHSCSPAALSGFWSKIPRWEERTHESVLKPNTNTFYLWDIILHQFH